MLHIAGTAPESRQARLLLADHDPFPLDTHVCLSHRGSCPLCSESGPEDVFPRAGLLASFVTSKNAIVLRPMKALDVACTFGEEGKQRGELQRIITG